MNKELAISLENISKSYKLYEKPIDRLKEALHPLHKKFHKDFYALKDITLEVFKGEVLGIIGINGAGKSTLLKIISNVVTPTSGNLVVNGKVNAILELGTSLKNEMSGLDNIILNLHILGIKDNKDNIVKDILDFVDLKEYIYQPVKNYSSGMKARLGFAIATLSEPDILILDEVLAVGDIVFKRKCFSKVQEFLDKNKTVIFVSHSEQSIIEFCTRAVLIHDKKIIMDDTPKNVTSFYQKIVFNNSKNDIYVEKNLKKIEKIEEKEFNKSLLNVNKIIIKNYDIDIYDPRILDKKGYNVNILKMNENYIYKFYIKFNLEAKKVSFGSQIKTVKGLTISLCSLKESNSCINRIEKGIYEISWSFTCKLLPGTYCIDSSSSGVISDEREVLCRVKDIIMFQVEEIKDCPYQGLVNLDQRIIVKRI